MCTQNLIVKKSHKWVSIATVDCYTCSHTAEQKLLCYNTKIFNWRLIHNDYKLKESKCTKPKDAIVWSKPKRRVWFEVWLATVWSIQCCKQERRNTCEHIHLHRHSNRNILWVLDQALYPGDSHVQIVHCNDMRAIIQTRTVHMQHMYCCLPSISKYNYLLGLFSPSCVVLAIGSSIPIATSDLSSSRYRSARWLPREVQITAMSYG